MGSQGLDGHPAALWRRLWPGLSRPWPWPSAPSAPSPPSSSRAVALTPGLVPPPPAQSWGLPSPRFLPVAPKLGGCRRRSATLSQRALWCQQTGEGGQCWGLLGWERAAPAGGREKRRNPEAGAGGRTGPLRVCACPSAQVTRRCQSAFGLSFRAFLSLSYLGNRPPHAGYRGTHLSRKLFCFVWAAMICGNIFFLCSAWTSFPHMANQMSQRHLLKSLSLI